MRLRAVAADRLALALAEPKGVDEPGGEQENEQRAGEPRPARAKGNVAEHVQKGAEHAETRNGIGKLDQPVKHSNRLIPRPRRARSCRESAFRAHSQSSSSSNRAIPSP